MSLWNQERLHQKHSQTYGYDRRGGHSQNGTSLEVTEVIEDIEVHKDMQTSVDANKGFHKEENESKQTDNMTRTSKTSTNMATKAAKKEKATSKCLQPLQLSYLPNLEKPRSNQ